MLQVFTEINRMVEENVFSSYALGGSVAYMAYTEPFATEDIDIFILLLPNQKSSLLISLDSLYDYAKKNNLEVDREFIYIDGEAVQFIPAPTDLEEVAIKNAVAKNVFGTSVPTMTPEYLICTSLRAGRLKDFSKIERLLEQYQDIDYGLLDKLLSSFDLVAAWNKLQKLLGEKPSTPKIAYKSLVYAKITRRNENARKSFEYKLQTLKRLNTR